MKRHSQRTKFVRRLPILLLFGFVITWSVVKFSDRAHAQAGGTRLLRTPTVSATQLAFAYAENLWTVARAGGPDMIRNLNARSMKQCDC